MSTVTPPILTPPRPFRMKGTEDAPIAPAPKGGLLTGDDLKAQFGFSGKSDPNSKGNKAARADFLSRKPTGSGEMQDYAPEPKFGDPGMPANSSEPMSLDQALSFGANDQRNRGIRQSNLAQIGRAEEREGERAAQIAQAQEIQRRNDELAAQEALRADFGTTDPKLIQYQIDLDRKAALAEGFEADIADIRRQHVAEANQAADEEMRKQIDARYDREYQNRLARYTVDLGQNVPGQAFAQLKQQPQTFGDFSQTPAGPPNGQ